MVDIFGNDLQLGDIVFVFIPNIVFGSGPEIRFQNELPTCFVSVVRSISWGQIMETNHPDYPTVIANCHCLKIFFNE